MASDMRRRLLLGGVLLAGAAVLFLLWFGQSSTWVRDRVVMALNERFASHVELGSLQLSLLPRPRASGTSLIFRHNGRTDVPPLITIGTFDASASVVGLVGPRVRLREANINSLDIYIPRRPRRAESQAEEQNIEDLRARKAPADLPPHPVHPVVPSSIVIDRVVARSARLEIPSARPGRLSRIFEIHDLALDGVGRRDAWRFQAGITNPIPRGRVETTGTFGPWDEDDPDFTPLSGQYTFSRADMDAIRGIGGILSSVGTYHGVLQRIEVEGQTEIPDFSLDIAGQPVPLATRFKAVVDGTNGDTWLERVEARIAESTVVASGAVVRTEDVRGRGIVLDVRMTAGRIEDLMRLTVKADQSPLVGRIDMETSFLLPAGPQDIVDRLRLEGRFNLAEARFTNLDVQRRINELSERGRADDNTAKEGESVVSNLGGRFVLRNATLQLSELRFSVPGATVQLAGSYNLHRQLIDFQGDLLLDARLADMTSGVKSLLARVAQPFFRGPNGGTRLPIRITGTRSRPSFRLDVRRVFRR
jgi:hypothetical protein